MCACVVFQLPEWQKIDIIGDGPRFLLSAFASTMYPGGPKTRHCPLVVGILCMDHPKDHSLFGLGLSGCTAHILYIYISIDHLVRSISSWISTLQQLQW